MSDERIIRILLVEDNPADVYLLRCALLDAKGVRVDLIVLSDGEAAIDYINARASEKIVDLVVLDLNLPKTGGSDVLRSVRANRSYDRVPVAILTSSDSYEDRDGALQFGADSYFTKPTNLDEYLRLGPILVGMAKPRLRAARKPLAVSV